MSQKRSKKMELSPEQLFEKLVPRDYRPDVLQVLGSSIELAHHHGQDRWGITLGRISIMLKVGSHEILQVGDWELPFHLIVDEETVPADLRRISRLHFSKGRDYYGSRTAAGYYPSNPGTEACDMPFDEIAGAYKRLYDSHAEVVARAAQRRRHLSIPRTHSPEMVRFVARELGRPLPQPRYSRDYDENQELPIAEQVPMTQNYIEGATRLIKVNAYERSPLAREACLRHYGHACTVCDIDFEEIYGEIGAGFIHVHHLLEISLVGEEYQVDPISDLRPVCPNCHACCIKEALRLESRISDPFFRMEGQPNPVRRLTATGSGGQCSRSRHSVLPLTSPWQLRQTS
jgi:hypothetical protein